MARIKKYKPKDPSIGEDIHPKDILIGTDRFDADKTKNFLIDDISNFVISNISKEHNDLLGRDVNNAHPISSISGLQNELNQKIEDAPIDGNLYVRKNGDWFLYEKSFINYFEFDNSAVTNITQNVWVKLNTVNTTSLFSRGNLVHSNNRITRTGEKKVFKVEGIISVSSGNNQEVHAAFFRNGVLYPCSEQSAVLSSGGKSSAIPFHCLIELDENDYIEVWVKNFSSSTNITLSNVNVIVTEM